MAHAERTEHSNFEESTQEVAPLTEEQKSQKLADLRARLEEKRAASEIAAKEERKRNEQIRMKSTKETQDAKEELKRKEQLKQAEAKRRERAEDIAVKEKIKRQIAADKEERRKKAEAEKAAREGIALPQASQPSALVSAPAQATSKPASAYTETRLRLQTKGKGNIMLTLPVDTTLYEVALRLEGPEHGIPEIEGFVQGFPKKIFERAEERTLKELGLVPSASLVVQ
jgi:UBX domain-containing protein 1/4